MKRGNKILMVFKFIVLGAIFVTGMGFAIMYLWNWLIPDIMGFKAIGFVQALGLFILSKLLFGGFGGKKHHGGGPARWKKRADWKRMMEYRMANMTDEQKEKFRRRFKNRCDGLGWHEEMNEPENTNEKA